MWLIAALHWLLQKNSILQDRQTSSPLLAFHDDKRDRKSEAAEIGDPDVSIVPFEKIQG